VGHPEARGPERVSASFPLAVLSEPLTQSARVALERGLTELLTWQRSLAGWPEKLEAPDATPIVSLYRSGTLAGCAGMAEGEPSARLQRAFLSAQADPRFGGLDQAARAELVAQVSYAVRPRRLPLSRALSELEVGVHGLVLARSGNQGAALLPDVARDHRLGAAEFLEALAQKAGVPRETWSEKDLWVFETERVIARSRTTAPSLGSARAAAIRWLGGRVARSGAIVFGLDPRDGSETSAGPMWHGRAAIALRALDSCAEGHHPAERARRWLSREISDVLAGKPVRGWPEERAVQLGSLALAALAGIELPVDLREFAAEPALLDQPWHAAQVAAALGARAPAELIRRCARDLEVNPWAPWTAIAAHRHGDAETLTRAISGLIASVRESAPHAGGVGPGAVAELARTAASVEALSLVDDEVTRSAVRRACAFLVRHQLRAENHPLSANAEWCDGGFPVSPVNDYLQTDVTAHAALALSHI
jgi:AMMECR1 domain-containing protein